MLNDWQGGRPWGAPASSCRNMRLLFRDWYFRPLVAVALLGGTDTAVRHSLSPTRAAWTSCWVILASAPASHPRNRTRGSGALVRAVQPLRQGQRTPLACSYPARHLPSTFTPLLHSPVPHLCVLCAVCCCLREHGLDSGWLGVWRPERAQLAGALSRIPHERAGGGVHY